MSRIERWTRHLLEAEAHKRGIRDPEARTRTELLFAIAQHDVSARPRQGLRSARKLLGSIVESLPLLGSRSSHAHRAAPSPLRAREPSAFTPQPAAASQLTASTEPSRLQLRREAGQLELSWQVNPLDAQRARRLLGHQQGELSLRIVCVQADPQQVVRSSVTEHGPLEPEGAWSWTLPGPDSHCVGSVGVRHGGQFVSIAHESSRVPISPVG